jgi:F-box and leucine-rich repeat protein 10/11
MVVRPPPRKSERSHVNIDYTSLNLGDTTNILPDQHAYDAFFEGDTPRKFAEDRFQRMQGQDLTKEWAEETGCKEPVVIPKGSSEGMGMEMPSDLTVRKVAELVGPDTKVEVIGMTRKFGNLLIGDVPTQKEVPNWKLKQWAEYYDAPADQRDRVRNVMYLHPLLII